MVCRKRLQERASEVAWPTCVTEAVAQKRKVTSLRAPLPSNRAASGAQGSPRSVSCPLYEAPEGAERQMGEDLKFPKK